MKKIVYVTGNWAKLASAKQALEPLGYVVENVKMETPEIQADDVSEVAKYSAKWAALELNVPVLKNDSGLFVNALNGFPGVYTHYVDDTLGVDGLLKLMKGIKDRTAYFKESIAYCEPGEEPIVFEGITKGKIDVKKSGKYGWSWDFVFIPEGEDKTLGCFPDEERWNFWSLDAYRDLAKYLDVKIKKKEKDKNVSE
ncbi:MAG: non-canonical purine NTP pyrophosphatase [Bacilli bacterium]|nr:non-canonical purine NTP pyrophosphatase [Bacilli bacterium]